MTALEIDARITNAMKILKTKKGKNTFTAKEYEQFGGNKLSLQALRDKSLVKIDHYETFVKTIPNSSSECYIYNSKNQIVMKWKAYMWLPRIAQEALIKSNDGEPFEIKCPEEITISCKRYYYVADYDEMVNYKKKEMKYFLAKKEKKEQELIEINNKIEKLEEIFK